MGQQAPEVGRDIIILVILILALKEAEEGLLPMATRDNRGVIQVRAAALLAVAV